MPQTLFYRLVVVLVALAGVAAYAYASEAKHEIDNSGPTTRVMVNWLDEVSRDGWTLVTAENQNQRFVVVFVTEEDDLVIIVRDFREEADRSRGGGVAVEGPDGSDLQDPNSEKPVFLEAYSATSRKAIGGSPAHTVAYYYDLKEQLPERMRITIYDAEAGQHEAIFFEREITPATVVRE